MEKKGLESVERQISSTVLTQWAEGKNPASKQNITHMGDRLVIAFGTWFFNILELNERMKWKQTSYKSSHKSFLSVL